VTLWVRNVPVESEECKWIYERSYIWTAEKDMNLWLIIAVQIYKYPTNAERDLMSCYLNIHCKRIVYKELWGHEGTWGTHHHERECEACICESRQSSLCAEGKSWKLVRHTSKAWGNKKDW